MSNIQDEEILGTCFCCEEPVLASEEWHSFNDGTIAHRDCHRDAN